MAERSRQYSLLIPEEEMGIFEIHLGGHIFEINNLSLEDGKINNLMSILFEINNLGHIGQAYMFWYTKPADKMIRILEVFRFLHSKISRYYQII